MRHIRELDGLRGLLALWVFIAHAFEFGPFPRVEAHMRAFLAVDIFFILSGFVIFHLLNEGEDYATFITRRFLRLFPVFAACFLLAVVLRATVPGMNPIAFGFPAAPANLSPYLTTHALMLHGMMPEQWLPMSAVAILPTAWSISVEWQFYLLAPWLFALLRRPRWILVAGLLLIGLIRLLIERHSLGVLFPGGPRDLTFQMNAFFPLKVELFALGGLSWMAWRRLADAGFVLPRQFRWASLIGFPIAWCATGSLPIAAWLAVFAFLIDARFGAGTGLSAAAAALLNARPVRFLGKVSYPFYLVHLPVIALVARGVVPVVTGPKPIIAALIIAGAGLGSLAVAWLLHVTIEAPCIRWGKGVVGNWKVARPAAALVGTKS